MRRIQRIKKTKSNQDHVKLAGDTAEVFWYFYSAPPPFYKKLKKSINKINIMCYDKME